MAKWPYNTTRWTKLRAAKLRANPLCEYCATGQVTPATQVDHKQAINKGGDPWDWDNLASTCARCHTNKTNREDGGCFGTSRNKAVDPATGRPLDPDHWWNDKISQG